MALSDAFVQIGYNEILRIRDKKIAKEDRVLTAKILVKKVILGFHDEWKTYSDCHVNYTTDVVTYNKFIFTNNRLRSHLNTFLDVSGEIRATGILPESVPDRLQELATRMQYFLLMATSNDDWNRDDPYSIPNSFDTLMIDVSKTYENFDDYCDEIQ